MLPIVLCWWATTALGEMAPLSPEPDIFHSPDGVNTSRSDRARIEWMPSMSSSDSVRVMASSSRRGSETEKFL